MRRRIVLATDSLEPSGMGEHMLTLGVELACDYDLAIACPDGAAGMPLLRRAARQGLRIKAVDPGRPDLFRHWLRASGADLVHVHAGIGWEGHGLVRAAKAAGLPVVRTEHLPYLLTSVVQQAEYRAMLLMVDRRIAVSRAVADSHAGRGGGPMAVVLNGLAPRVPAASGEACAALGIGSDDRLLLTVARFTAQKGHDLLLKAGPAVIKACPHAKFVLVGSGPEKARVEAAIAEQKLGGSFLVLGSRDDVPELLASADMFVLPSHFEGLPLVVLEAMAAGVPVVATSIAGSLEALGEGHPFLVPAGDADALAGAIVAALNDPERARSSAVAARSRFETEFTADRMARETAPIYESLLPSQPTEGGRA